MGKGAGHVMRIAVFLENSTAHCCLGIPLQEECLHLGNLLLDVLCLLRCLCPRVIVPVVAFPVEPAEDILHGL